MGLMDMVESMAQQYGGGGGGGNSSQVTGGLLQELQQQPGGVTGILQHFQNNGMGGLVQQWGSGQTQPATTEQVEQGLGPTGMIDNIAQRVGMSPGMVKMGLAVAVPVLIHHLVSNGHVTPDGQPTGSQPNIGGMLGNLL